ncbi:hypothetical protein [Macrococcus capreoli]|uniref:hypothetical protein n=1 Tax=Macrococcus capreoli TaxID=2982690 RepID=UPI0021D581FD|nr:hypothetical protein [Macrococcus sp. TMW 2.2395]MCU7557276.1 hypothetical protein [Macrococcus sp. TMW 2.2395]
MKSRRHRAILWAEQGHKRKKSQNTKVLSTSNNLLVPIEKLSDFAENAARSFNSVLDFAFKRIRSIRLRRDNNY